MKAIGFVKAMGTASALTDAASTPYACPMTNDRTPRELVDELAAVLRVQPTGDDLFEGARTPPRVSTGAGRMFGGQVIAQALMAAIATVPEDRPPHSLHAYFLRMGDDARPIHYAVARDLEGGSFSNRRVSATQGDRPILSLNASFHRIEEGLFHQQPMPDVPLPESLPSDHELRQAQLHLFPEHRRAAFAAPRPIDLRTVEPLDWLDPTPQPPETHTWFRAAALLPDDPRLHAAVLAYASDLAMLRTATLPHGLHWFDGSIMEASLDHAIWFHDDDFRADEWLLFHTHSARSGRGRGFITGRIFRRDGRLVASVTQEGMIRIVNKQQKGAGG